MAGAGGLRLGKVWTVLIIAQVTFAVAILPSAVAGAWKEAQDGLAGLGFPAEQYIRKRSSRATAYFWFVTALLPPPQRRV